MCGLSVYVISFNYQGYQFSWDTKQHCFTSPRSTLKFYNTPIGAYNIITSRKDPNEND